MNPELVMLAGEYCEDLFARNPTQALLQGDHRYDDRVEDLTRDAEDDAIAALAGCVARATEIDADALTADERVTLAVLVEEAGASRPREPWGGRPPPAEPD